MKKLSINLPDKNYDILIEKGLIENIGEHIKELYSGKRLYIVTDSNVNNIYRKIIEKILNESGFETFFTVVPAGEKSKSMKVLEEVYTSLLNNSITRTDMIISLGGGVVGDLTGFVAATLLRGIRFIQIPTTLLSQIDSSVGGKVAVNLEIGKNLVGSFYHPDGVFIDPNMLDTLEKRYLYDGTAEVIKYGCIKNLSLFQKLENINSEKEYLENIEDIIYTCCDIKREVVEEDEKDTGNRMLLNFGHTLGHCVEKAFNYEKFTHGEAVAIGMYHITMKDELLNGTNNSMSERIKNLLAKFNLSYNLPNIDIEDIKKTVGLDKKASGNTMKIVLLKSIGSSYLKEIKKEDIINYI